MSDISRRIANLSPEKRALFEKRLLQGGLAAAGAQAIPRRTDAGPWPLSFTQQRLWFLAQLQPGLVAYNEMLPLHVKGPLDVAALAKAVSAMTRRHEVLRTVYTQNAGEPAQVVLEAVEVPLQIIDVSDRPAGERFEAATLAVGRESGRQIEFSKGPFFRPLVVRIDEREHIVAFLIHHIIYDGWSRGVILAELSALYSAFSRGETPALGELPLQYADFAVWQQQWLLGDSLAEQFAYWQQQLAGAPVVEMPSDRPRPPVQTYSGDRVSFAIAQSLVDRASASAREHNATLFMTVMAAWKALIHRYTGLERVVVGTPIANRTRVELEPLIGFFANTLAIPTDLSGDPTFAELLRRERSAALGAFQNQDAPFEKLVERLHPERDPAHSPVCQVMLAMQNAPLPAPNLAGLEARLIDIGRAIAKFDLTLNIERGEAGLECQLEYNSDIFDRSTAARIARHFTALLESATASPATEISRLDMMSDDEPSTIAKWNSTARDYPRDSRVDQVFDLRAAASPDAVALVSEEASITYGALRASANRLANRLRAMGVREGSLVGLALERSPEMVVGMLATLKAGGAYIPLDPSYPRERIAFMISDARPAVLITTSALEERLRPTGVAVLRLDADKGAIAAESAEAPENSATAESPAYVMFTSGSTGRPKGTVIPHRGIVRLVVNTDCAQMTPSDVVSQVSNSSFDASTWEIYSALLNGARLVIITKDLLLSPRDFAAELKRRGVTALFLTTSLFNHFAREMPDAFCGIDWVLLGGEAADASCLRAVLAAGPPKRLINAYGPTESTTFSSWHEVAAVAERAVSVPIGRAIANTTQYVLDRHMELAPIGVPGEIWVGGDGLAIEYLNRPDLTAERFVASPLGPGRLYRTGDIGRLLESGDIEFLGRADTQVKIRGFRIELGEVEAAVAAHPLVKEVAAICREDSPGDKRLVAYFVPRDGHPDAAAIRSFLRERLPDYMMPSAFIELANLPINPNGKVDRRVLAHKSMAPSADAGAEPDGFVAPHTPVESVLARIWSEVIGVPRRRRAGQFLRPRRSLAPRGEALRSHRKGLRPPAAADRALRSADGRETRGDARRRQAARDLPAAGGNREGQPRAASRSSASRRPTPSSTRASPAGSGPSSRCSASIRRASYLSPAHPSISTIWRRAT